MLLFSRAYEIFLRKECLGASFGKRTFLSLALCHPWARGRNKPGGVGDQQRAKASQKPCRQAERLAWFLLAGATAIRRKQLERLFNDQEKQRGQVLNLPQLNGDSP